RRLDAGNPHSGSSRMAVAWGVRTSVTSDLNSSISASPILPPFSLASDFCNDPRWSMAAAAITPRSFDTFLSPASLPGVSFIDSSELVLNPQIERVRSGLGFMGRLYCKCSGMKSKHQRVIQTHFIRGATLRVCFQSLRDEQ